MRIAKLELLAYGPFQRLTLDFSAPGLHVVLGRNEAGKSTTLRAINGLLYGIDPKTPDAHVHKFGDLRIGGVLEDARGERVRVVRRKGISNTLLDDADKPLDETILKKLLGGVSRETFVSAFGLDHDTLEAGARALLEGKGDLGESLFDASVGGGGEVQRLLAELASEADRIYKPRASALPLNEALKAFAEAQKSVRERQSLPEAFLVQEAALKEASEERATRLAEREALMMRRTRLERARRRVPIERRRQRATERRAELGALFEQVARVLALQGRFAAYEHAVAQERTHLAETERLVDRVAEASRRAGLVAAELDKVRLDDRREARIHGLLRERTALQQKLDAAASEIAKQDRELARIEMPEVTAVDDELPAALERARALGDVETRLAGEKVRIERKTKDLEAKAKTLFEGSLEELVALRVPGNAALERVEVRAVELERTQRRVDDRAEDLRKEFASIAKQLATQTGDFAPPDAAALERARALRDEAWAATLAAPSVERRLETERLLRDADAVADRMIREADRVTSLARLRSESEHVASEIAKVASERARLADERAAISAERDALVAGIVTDDLRGWLDRRLRIVEVYESLREAEAALADETAAVADARQALRAALADGASRGDAPASRGDAPASRGDAPASRGDAPASRGDARDALGGGDGVTLRELIALAARRIGAYEAARRAADEARRRKAKLREDIDERTAAVERDRAALAEGAARLREVLEPLGIPADASADEVNRSLEALRDLFGAIEKRAEAEARGRAARAEVVRFEDDLAHALAELAPDLAVMRPADAGRLFFARANEAKVAADEIAATAAELEADGTTTLSDEERELVADPEVAEKAQQELTERIEDLDQQCTRLTERIGAVRSGLARMSVDSLASEAAADAQQALARVRENAERWSRTKLAWVLLSREIERYRQEHQAPLLASSSSLFSRLTLGAYSGIKAGFDDKDRPCLRCVRGGEEVDVAGLSDGTRDQLYLSLRLASLLRRAEAAEPMPLVLDDVLIQLDDSRAAAALTVLAEVAKRMQVLLFTHHARIVDLARSAVKDLVVHELGAPPPDRQIGLQGI